ncbi:hypothetical protein EX895_004168 [Sporisorium graminicola]|uniref:Uncharacterized protein n=1 Tax=Sporisorium graminicola TaxID=280036 RepID=A0A4U7KR35_9BASI|nr:hypothetical protein EX895_004168 [Sporisorium graminicola]TKY86880.1 hypothetical protein EX895_004168 [Sporisorium graminicola]
MSLRFLTRRRDRDRERSDSSTSASYDKSPASTRVVLPPSDSFFNKGKAALAPSEVQIISWHPLDLQASGREVHISTRAETAAVSSATPVHHAFTAWPSSSKPTSANKSGNADEIANTHSRGSDVGHTFFSARHPPAHRSYDSKSSNRIRPKTAPRSQIEPTWPDPTFSDLAIGSPRAPSATDTPRSEDVEELNSSLGALPPLDQPAPTRSTLPIRLTSKARRAKSRSHHTHSSYTSAHDDDLNTHDLPTSSFTGAPSSLPSASGLGFLLLHRNASVPSFADLFHTGGAREQSTDESEAGPSPSASSGFLSRIGSTRQLRRSKNASVAEAESSASANLSGYESKDDARSRSQSISLITSKLMRSKDHTQVPPMPRKGGKLTRSAAPPSAWRTDAAAVTVGASVTGDVSSSAYSSENEPSIGPGSSCDHALESGGGPAFTSRHVKNVSIGDMVTTTAAHPSLVPASSLFPPSAGAGSLDMSSSISSYSTRSAASPAALTPPRLHLDRANSSLDSPHVSGLPLPLPLPPSNPASPGGTIFTTQLLKRIGPPPLGLAAELFEDRVMLIRNYVLNQLPLPLTPNGDANEDDLDGYAAFSSRSQSFRGYHLHRSSLPPPPRHGSTYNSSSTASASGSHLTTLQDEFDKLECLAEQELSKLAHPPSPQQQRDGNDREEASFSSKSGLSATTLTYRPLTIRPVPYTTRPPSSNDTHSTNSSSHCSHTTHRSTLSSSSSAAIRSPLLFGHDLTRTVVAVGGIAVDRVMEGAEGERGKGGRDSQDTQLTDSDCYVEEGAVVEVDGWVEVKGKGKGKGRMVEW